MLPIVDPTSLLSLSDLSDNSALLAAGGAVNEVEAHLVPNSSPIPSNPPHFPESYNLASPPRLSS